MERKQVLLIDNDRFSLSVLQRLGMSFVERREFHGLDTVFYSLTADEFAEHLEAQRELDL